MIRPGVQAMLDMLRGTNFTDEEASALRHAVDIGSWGSKQQGERCPQRDLLGAQCIRHSHFADPELPNQGHVFDEAEPIVPIVVRTGGLADELASWWRGRAESEISQTVAKATEYSGLGGGLPQDLVDLGRQIAFVQRREHEFTDAELAEIGVWSYMQGKLNRWSSALRNGRMVSDDTLLDIGVYVRIAQRIRERGQWP